MSGIRLDFGERAGKYLVVLLFIMMHFLMQRQRMSIYVEVYENIYQCNECLYVHTHILIDHIIYLFLSSILKFFLLIYIVILFLFSV